MLTLPTVKSAGKVRRLSPKKHATGHFPNNGFCASDREPHLQISLEYGRLEMCGRLNETPKHPQPQEQENTVGGEKKSETESEYTRKGRWFDEAPKAPFIPPNRSHEWLKSRPLPTQEPDRRPQTMLLCPPAAGELASQGDLITAEKRAARRLMEKQVKWRVLSELGSQRPDGGGGAGGGGGEDDGKAAWSPSGGVTGLHILGQ